MAKRHTTLLKSNFPPSAQQPNLSPFSIGERGATLVEYAITTAILIGILVPGAIFVTRAVENRVADSSKIHDSWCIPDPVDAAQAALCN